MAVAERLDVERTLMRELEDDEARWVDALLERAEALILLRMPDAVNRCRTDYAFRVALIFVECEAVSRVLRAPGGGLYKYETEGTYTYSINSAVASGLLEITPKDWQALEGGVGGWGGVAPVMDGYARNRHGGGWSPDVSKSFLMSFRPASVPDKPAAPELGLQRWEGWHPSW